MASISIFIALILVILCVFGFWFVYRELRPLVLGGGPYVPTQHAVVKQMIAAARLTPDDAVVDLGSGDGRIVLEAVISAGCRGRGIEIDPRLVRKATSRAQALGIENRATFACANFWASDLSDATVVFLFQVPRTMQRLEQELKTRLRPGTRIVSNYFIFPHWTPVLQEGEVTVYRR